MVCIDNRNEKKKLEVYFIYLSPYISLVAIPHITAEARALIIPGIP